MSGLTAISFLPELGEKSVLSTSERCPPQRELSDRETWEIQLGGGITIPLEKVSALLLYSGCLIARPVHALECIIVITATWLEIQRFLNKFKMIQSIEDTQFLAL